MKRSILNRYARTETGALILDVAANRVSDLYEDIDKVSPFLKKDLDPHLAEYLTECAKEIGREPFVIRIALNEVPTGDLKERVIRSVESFFAYMTDVERRKMGDMARMSLILLVLGLGFLSLAAYTSEWMAGSDHILAHVFPEGITVAGWVSLWNASATFLIDWLPRRRNIRVFRRLSSAPIEFLNGT